MSCTSGCLDNTLQPCPPTCNCTTNDITYNGANNLCVGVVTGSKLTDILTAIEVFATNRLYDIAGSTSIKTTSIPSTCNKLTQAEVIISPDSNNALSLHGNGLFVSESQGLNILDTNSIDLTLSSGVLSADSKISATAGNSLVINSDGLFVPSGATVTADNGLTKTGNNIQLGGSLIKTGPTYIGVSATNFLAISPNLFANEAIFANNTILTYADTASVGTILDPAGFYTVSDFNTHYVAETILRNTDYNISEKYTLGQVRITDTFSSLEFNLPLKSGEPTVPPTLPILPSSTYFRSELSKATIKATDLILPDILNTKDDTTTYEQINNLYTNASGKVCSAPYYKSATTLAFTSPVAANTSSELTMTIIGGQVGDNVVVNSVSVNPANSSWTAYISAANTATIRFNNYSTSPITPGSCLIHITLFKFPSILDSCVVPSFTDPTALPNGNAGHGYSHTLNVVGTAPFALSAVTKPAWMTITVVGNVITFAGTPPSTDFVGSPVSFTLTNNCGNVNYSQTIMIDTACEAFYNNSGGDLTGITYTDCETGTVYTNQTIHDGETICTKPGSVSGGQFAFLNDIGTC